MAGSTASTVGLGPVSADGAGAAVGGREPTVSLVTTIIGVVVGLTFLFGFGNGLALGLRLGVPVWVAPLVAPAVDLSVVGLLIAIRHLALHGGPVEVLRAARRLLLFSSLVTLALNVADPVITGHYGKAAFDAVGPLLLIGWAEVGPGLLHAMQATATAPGRPAATAAEGQGHDGRRPDVLLPAGPAGVARPPRTGKRRVSESDLVQRARAEDALHWQAHRRPISAETLRKRLRVGAATSRALVDQIRADVLTRDSSTQQPSPPQLQTAL